MSGNLAPYPIWQFFDQNGDPLSGGSIEWFAAGTQNRVSIFADVALDVPLPNPVPLDAAGRPRTGSGPTAIWLDSGRAYKAVHRDAEGRVLWTADNLVSPGTGVGVPGPPGPPGSILGVATYSQGTFAPTFTTAAGDESGQVYQFQQGFWEKVGGFVAVSGRVSLTQKGTWPNDQAQVVIGGLPFPVNAAASDIGSGGAVMIPLFNGLLNPWATLNGVAVSHPNGFDLFGYATHYLDNPYTASFIAVNLSDTTDMTFAGFYLTEFDPSQSDPEIEQVIADTGTVEVQLSSGPSLHLVHCQNDGELTLWPVVSTPDPPRIGDRLIITSMGLGIVWLAGDPASSFVNDITSHATPILGGAAEYVYSGTWDHKWRLVSHRQRFPIQTWPAFDPANYGADYGNVWTVTAGQVLRQEYELIGNKIHLFITLGSTVFSPAGGGGGHLVLKPPVWGGYTPRMAGVSCGLVVMTDGDATNWDLPDNVTGWAQISNDRTEIIIQNLTRPFVGPNINLNAELVFEVE
jgi:hypothetical protein